MNPEEGNEYRSKALMRLNRIVELEAERDRLREALERLRARPGRDDIEVAFITTALKD